MDSDNQAVLGYTETSDGRYIAITKQQPGMVYTQAFIMCRECDKIISPVGGPAWKSICVDCYNRTEPNK